MMLRESSKKYGHPANIEALIQRDLDIGVPGGGELLAFADAVIGIDRDALEEAREALALRLGPAAVSAAASIAANFTKNDRIANGLGIPVEPMMLKGTDDIRQQLGLNDFRSAVNTYRHLSGDHPTHGAVSD